MTFEQFLKREVFELGRRLTAREKAFLQAAEAAGFEMEFGNDPSRGPHFFLETIEEDPMSYPCVARVRPETLEMMGSDNEEIRATMRRLIAEVKATVQESDSTSEASERDT